MRARVEILQTRPHLEKALAALGALGVAWVLLFRPHDFFSLFASHFTLFPLSIGVGVWLPLLSRSRGGGLGEIRREGDIVRIQAGRRRLRVPLGRVRGVRVAPAARGASLVLELDDGTVFAAAVEDREDARRLAASLRADAKAGEEVTVPTSPLSLAAVILRPIATLFALGYYLHVVEHAIPGSKPFYGLTALLSGFVLLFIHFTRHERRPLAPLAPGVPGLHVRDHTRALRAHVALHTRAPATPEPPAPPRPRLADPDEPLDRALPRLRRDLGATEAYRRAAHTVRERLEQALGSAAVPLRERAVALRLLAGRDREEVKRRIAEVWAIDGEDRAFLEAVALEESDEAALARVARRAPDFRA